jgi:hypothetical protein
MAVDSTKIYTRTDPRVGFAEREQTSIIEETQLSLRLVQSAQASRRKRLKDIQYPYFTIEDIHN